MSLEGLKLRPIKRKSKVVEEPKKRFNFMGAKKEVRKVKVAAWLEDKTVEQVADLWKIGHVQKSMIETNKQKFKEIKHCLKYKFDVSGI